jgi:hypothetical protein
MYISTWAIILGSVLTTFYVAFTKVREHSEDEIRVLFGERTVVRPGAAGIDDSEMGSKMAKSETTVTDNKR